MKQEQRVVLVGQTISFGIAKGEAFIYKDILSRQLRAYEIEESEVKREMKRIHSAIDEVLGDLEKIKNVVRSDIGENHARIFQVHKSILKDKQLLTDLKKELQTELINAEQAVKNVFHMWANKFAVSENETIRNRADDLRDLSRRVLKALLGYEKSLLEKLPSDSIVVSRRLLPSDTVHLKRKNLKGIVVEQGSGNSHSAILARELGIPAIVNFEQSIDMIKNGDEILLDGERGEVIVHPSMEDKRNYKRKAATLRKQNIAALKGAKEKARTKAGTPVFVYANASSEEDFRAAVSCGCDGIGLFRIERIYLSSKVMPDENFLLSRFREILHKVYDKEIYIRLLDIGGDKKLPYLNVEDELNPSLGLRGIRLLLKHENLLRTQIQAFLVLSKEFKIRLLLPLVTLCSEVKRVKNIIEECREELLKKYGTPFRIPQIGSMVEVPAAVVNIEDIAKHSDFLSLGTNDLIQYTMAAGRENYSVADYYEQGMDVIFDMVRKTISAAQKYSIECSICGEIAGDLNWTERLLKAGLRILSVSPHRIPPLKEKIRNIFLS